MEKFTEQVTFKISKELKRLGKIKFNRHLNVLERLPYKVQYDDKIYKNGGIRKRIYKIPNSDYIIDLNTGVQLYRYLGEEDGDVVLEILANIRLKKFEIDIIHGITIDREFILRLLNAERLQTFLKTTKPIINENVRTHIMWHYVANIINFNEMVEFLI